MALDLRGRSAVVTGSSKGIGFAIAETLAKWGADVVISARNADEVANAVGRVNAIGGGKAIGVPCDMRDHAQVRSMIGRGMEEFGRIDILINNAGVGSFAPVDQLSVEQWEQVIETNLNGVFYACHEVIPHMKSRGDGWIINIASLAGKNALPGGTAYNASKFGLVGFSEALMLDVRDHGIRVNYIMPGSVATHFNDHEPGEEDAWKIQPDDIAQLVIGLLEMPARTLPSRIEVRPSRPPRR